MSDPAVAVTCHEPYLKRLPEALASIDRQRITASDRIVAFDGCAAPALPGSWRAVTGEWHHPSKARNAGLATTTSQWVVFWDADNMTNSDGTRCCREKFFDEAIRFAFMAASGARIT